MPKFVLPDEDAWVMPEAWRAGLHPRRGGVAVPPPVVQDDAAEILRAVQEDDRTVTARARIAARDVIFDPGLLAEGESWLADPPIGGSARAAAVAALIGGRSGETAHFYAAVWASAGPVFAAEVIGEMAMLIAERSLWTIDPSPEKTYERLWRGDDLKTLYAMATAVRSHLVASTPSAYAEACRVLAGHRGTPTGRIITSYLAPTMTAWVDEDCAAAAGWRADDSGGPDLDWGDHRALSGVLLLAASTTRHLEQLRDVLNPMLLSYARLGEVATVLDGVGLDAVPLLFEPFYRDALRLIDHDARFALRTRIGPLGLRVLPLIPTDDAMLILFQDLISPTPARPATLFKSGMLTRYPRRALIVLSELAACGGSPLWQDLLGGVLLSEPRLLPAVSDRLPPAVRARCEAIVSSGGAGIGRAWADLLDQPAWHDRFDSAADERRAVAALAAIPTEEAAGLLVDRIDRKYVRPELLKAAKRNPVLFLRVLLDKAPGSELLRNHVLTYPEAISALPPSARAALTVEVPEPAAGGVTPLVLAGGPSKDLPEWLVLATLPPVRVRDGGVLSPGAVRRLCELLAASKIGAPGLGLADVRDLAESSDLAALAWTVLEQWRAAQYPTGGNLAMIALATLGDDGVVPRLTALFPEWAAGSSMRVRTGMDVLAAIGTDTALAALERLSRRARTEGFRRFARERLLAVASARGLHPDQLADRIVPPLGLDSGGRLVLDYGSRRFTVTLDDQLRPVITSPSGKLLSRLPRPSATDDPAAHERFAEFKKELKTVAADRIRAVEEAMATGRRWSAAEFAELILDHPLMAQLARRLLWVAFPADIPPVVFRVAEDRTFADLDDKAFALDPAATVAVAHPWHFAADREAWASLLADYAVIQPFPQVSRELFTTADPLPAPGAEVVGSKLFVLSARGWRFTAGHSEVVRDWPGDLTVTIAFGPGYHWQEPDLPQHLRSLHITREGDPADLSALNPIAVSEVIRDARFLTRN